MARGSFIKVGSSREGIRVTTARYSPGNLATGTGTEAVLQRWSDVSAKYEGALCLDGRLRPCMALDAPCDKRIVESRERPDEIPPVLPLDFLAMITSSKSLMCGEDDGAVSLSCRNSLKAMVGRDQEVRPLPAKMGGG